MSMDATRDMTTDDRIASMVELGREDVARDTYGDLRVDLWFREVDGTDPDAAREDGGGNLW